LSNRLETRDAKMELGWPLDDVLPHEISKFSQNELGRLAASISHQHYFSTYRRDAGNGTGLSHASPAEKIRFIIDNLGRRSATAQGLGKAITSFDRMNYGEQQLIYILRSEPAPVAVDDVGDSQQTSNPTKIFGFIKVGAKSLFVMDKQGQQLEVKPLCVLDFYVVEEMQRKGCGRRLFDFMLSDLSIRPAQLAVDRPSVKFKSFLRKHYSLSHTIPQINNFVIFDGFFRFNHSKRNRNRLTDDFSDRRRYQRYARGQSERRQSKTALPRLVAPEKPPEPELPVIPNPAARLVEKLPESAKSEPLLHKRRVHFDPTVGPHQVSELKHNSSKLREENYGAYLSQWHPRNRRATHATPSATFGAPRHYSRHNSAFNLFGFIDKR